MNNTPQLNGILFEKEVHQSLKSTNYTILSERDIRNKYGSNISGIDHLIDTDNYVLCIQDKFMKTKPSVSQIHHFIQCVLEIYNKEKKKCIGIYLSNLPPTREAIKSFESMNSNNEDVYFKSINNDIEKLINSLLEYLHILSIYSYEDDGSCIMRSNDII